MSEMLVVGSIGIDTLHVHNKKHEGVLGGSATYGALAGSLFSKVQLVGVVGQDFPDEVVQKLRDRGVDVQGLEVTTGKTFHWEGRYADDFSSRETLATELNVLADFQPKVPEAYRKTQYVMLGNIMPHLQISVLDQMEGPSFVIADTMNFWIDSKREDLERLLERVHVLVINDEEARQLARVHNLVHAGRVLQKMGPSMVIVKKGEHGALLFDNEELFSAAALPLDHVADPTGAGDSFAGGMLGYLAQTGETNHDALRRAVIYGTVAASFCVEGVGIERLTDVSAKDIDDRFEQVRRLVHFS